MVHKAGPGLLRAWAPRQIRQQLGFVVRRLSANVAAEVQHVDGPQRNIRGSTRNMGQDGQDMSGLLQWEDHWEYQENVVLTGENGDI